MIIDTKYSLKPFGSGTSCIDTIHGECVRNVSVDECVKICENDPACGCGYHVEIKNRSPPIQNYCVPLNTIAYKNRPVALSLISTEKNGTILSKENNVDITFFRDEKMFPSINDTFNELKSSFIFNYDIVNFHIKNKKNNVFLQTILPNALFFSSETITDFYMIVKGFDFSVGEVTRLHNDDVNYFFYKHTTLCLTYDHDIKQFLWNNYTENKSNQTNVYHIQSKDNSRFIDNDTEVYIYTEYNGKKYYITINSENDNYEQASLQMTTEKPKSLKLFVTDDIGDIGENTIKSIPNKKLLKDRVEYMNSTMKTYLDNYFPDKSNFILHTTNNNWTVTHTILSCLILVCFYFILFQIVK
jgi:hypothetical protein